MQMADQTIQFQPLNKLDRIARGLELNTIRVLVVCMKIKLCESRELSMLCSIHNYNQGLRIFMLHIKI